ncbi:alpha/beta hydrolase, putative [Plasmodium berghei]|uniref:Alpha/beta hydrolase, putative n=2 Tax=Plasmodium berghei TaxID=5821 RepID=A0A509AHX7_PLABA|nr:alpha/beta hydrolase, putative [Plasmodium berghei ANKA]SCM20187.1 alpha/beta hydrolase, putative [Plasmodium berghei]SCO59252.1 alpha/beta hydrolase, putative [Plasmodium berghei]SCO60202.1 alpha/beta hydrolase, putative [Plasmodium berghei]VUC54971.1 alpha/beta hydrolase, putative [Plasmodium berghei ANKA]|eukprot:XP_034420790.1 alpha/beta hydrolase, putative [Plasmodium berghei ANKA]
MPRRYKVEIKDNNSDILEELEIQKMKKDNCRNESEINEKNENEISENNSINEKRTYKTIFKNIISPKNDNMPYDANDWNDKKKKKKKKTNKNENENETAKDKNNNDDEKFITYKIPKYLRKRNIKCPFIYKQVFYGKYGIVNYDLQGINKETLVITFHGLNGTNLTFLEIQKILIRYKFQVLNFDLYGHGLSACPKYNHRNKTYGIDFFLSQTEELLTHLNLLNRNFYLIGFSMGCIIATNFAKKYIKQVKKIILISPVGALEKKPFLVKLLKFFPCIINISSFFMLPYLISKRNFKKKKTNIANDMNSEDEASYYMYNRIMWQAFAKKNITHSILGCINNLKMWSSHEIFKEVGLHNIPVLILCGDKDNICSVHVLKNTSKLFANSHLIIFKNASHLVLVDKSKEINSCVLIFFLSSNNTNLKACQHMFPVGNIET